MGDSGWLKQMSGMTSKWILSSSSIKFGLYTGFYEEIPHGNLFMSLERFELFFNSSRTHFIRFLKLFVDIQLFSPPAFWPQFWCCWFVKDPDQMDLYRQKIRKQCNVFAHQDCRPKCPGSLELILWLLMRYSPLIDGPRMKEKHSDFRQKKWTDSGKSIVSNWWLTLLDTILTGSDSILNIHFRRISLFMLFSYIFFVFWIVKNSTFHQLPGCDLTRFEKGPCLSCWFLRFPSLLPLSWWFQMDLST